MISGNLFTTLYSSWHRKQLPKINCRKGCTPPPPPPPNPAIIVEGDPSLCCQTVQHQEMEFF